MLHSLRDKAQAGSSSLAMPFDLGNYSLIPAQRFSKPPEKCSYVFYF